MALWTYEPLGYWSFAPIVALGGGTPVAPMRDSVAIFLQDAIQALGRCVMEKPNVSGELLLNYIHDSLGYSLQRGCLSARLDPSRASGNG
jgi:hypothetical protein